MLSELPSWYAASRIAAAVLRIRRAGVVVGCERDSVTCGLVLVVDEDSDDDDEAAMVSAGALELSSRSEGVDCSSGSVFAAERLVPMRDDRIRAAADAAHTVRLAGEYCSAEGESSSAIAARTRSTTSWSLSTSHTPSHASTRNSSTSPSLVLNGVWNKYGSHTTNG